MKKYLALFLLMVSFLSVISCKKKDNENIEIPLQILTVNDFHGAISTKASKLAYVLNQNVEKYANTIVLSAGDMFQGSALSKYHYGRDMIDLMNEMNFQAMTIGNHEFDWNLKTILNYFDGDIENGEANFPLLGCNLIEKSTQEIPDFVNAYHIIETADLKIGVIGYLGFGLEDSIAQSMIEDYEILDPVAIIGEVAKELREIKKVDIVVAMGHDGSSDTNKNIANLKNEQRVDAIVNGHTHAKASGMITRVGDEQKIPYVQAGSSGEAIGKIILNFDQTNQKIINAMVSTENITSVTKEDEEIKKLVNNLILETNDTFGKVIGVSGRKLSTSTGIEWATNAMLLYCQDVYGECDVAFTNLGGIRDVAFPINIDEEITINRIYEMMPFDNMVKLVSLKGRILRSLINNTSEITYSKLSVKKTGNQIFINNVLLDDEATYRVACIDYIFDKSSYPFLNGENIVNTNVLFSDILIANIEMHTKNNEKCFMEGVENE